MTDNTSQTVAAPSSPGVYRESRQVPVPGVPQVGILKTKPEPADSPIATSNSSSPSVAQNFSSTDVRSDTVAVATSSPPEKEQPANSTKHSGEVGSSGPSKSPEPSGSVDEFVQAENSSSTQAAESTTDASIVQELSTTSSSQPNSPARSDSDAFEMKTQVPAATTTVEPPNRSEPTPADSKPVGSESPSTPVSQVSSSPETKSDIGSEVVPEAKTSPAENESLARVTRGDPQPPRDIDAAPHPEQPSQAASTSTPVNEVPSTSQQIPGSPVNSVNSNTIGASHPSLSSVREEKPVNSLHQSVVAEKQMNTAVPPSTRASNQSTQVPVAQKPTAGSMYQSAPVTTNPPPVAIETPKQQSTEVPVAQSTPVQQLQRPPSEPYDYSRVHMHEPSEYEHEKKVMRANSQPSDDPEIIFQAEQPIQVSSELDSMDQVASSDHETTSPEDPSHQSPPHVSYLRYSHALTISHFLFAPQVASSGSESSVPHKVDDVGVPSSSSPFDAMAHQLPPHSLLNVIDDFYATHAIICTVTVGFLWLLMMIIQNVLERGRHHKKLNSQLVEAQEAVYKLKVDRTAFGQKEISYLEKIRSLETAQYNLKLDLDEAQKQILNLKEQSERDQVDGKAVTALKKQLNDVESEKEKVLDDLHRTKKEMALLQAAKMKVEEEVRLQSERFDETRKILKETEEELKKQKQLLQSTEDEVEKAELCITELETKLQQSKVIETQLLASEDTLRQRIASLIKQIEEKNETIEHLEQTIEEKENLNNALKETARDLERFASRQRRDALDDDDEAADQEENDSCASSSSVTLPKALDLAQLKADFVSSEKERSELKSKLESLEKDRDELKKKLAIKEAEIESQSASVKQAIDAKFKAEEQLSCLKEHFNMRDMEMTKRLATVEAQQLHKEDLTESLKQQAEKLKQEKEVLETNYTKLKSESAEYDNKCRMQILKLDTDLKKQWSLWREATEEVNDLRQVVKYLKQQLAEVTKASSSNDMPDYASDSGSLNGSGLDLPPPPPLPPELLMSFMASGSTPIPGGPSLPGPPQPPPFFMSPPQLSAPSLASEPSTGGLIDSLPPPPPPPLPPFLPPGIQSPMDNSMMYTAYNYMENSYENHNE